ncbi:MAG TPA: fumarylacetoacetate hydrolase family protein [Actinomycetota bacterium]|nr:fumarylacetoacetate hydrolase family protein [Actinomycetota bacterium]
MDSERAWTHVTGTEPGRTTRMLHHWMRALIEEGPRWWSEVADVARQASAIPEAHVDLGDVEVLAPLVPDALRDFLTFEDHVQRGARRRDGEVPAYWYEAPVYYKGNPRTVIGPDTECPWPPYTQRLDFELELALVVGVRGRDLTADEASAHIFGFTIFDDFSARDVQVREMSAWLGPAKGKDFANALGPCIVTADEVGAEPDLEMVCRVNGEEWGRARSSQMHWSWAEIVAHSSRGEDIHPGDVYGSGTPGGCCGLDLDRELSPGDVVELEIERIGVLCNTIGPRPDSS